MDFGKTVRLVRNELKFSQEQLARELSISFSTVNRWENRRSQPSQMAKELFFNYCKKKRIDLELLERKHKNESYFYASFL